MSCGVRAASGPPSTSGQAPYSAGSRHTPSPWRNNCSALTLKQHGRSRGWRLLARVAELSLPASAAHLPGPELLVDWTQDPQAAAALGSMARPVSGGPASPARAAAAAAAVLASLPPLRASPAAAPPSRGSGLAPVSPSLTAAASSARSQPGSVLAVPAQRTSSAHSRDARQPHFTHGSPHEDEDDLALLFGQGGRELSVQHAPVAAAQRPRDVALVAPQRNARAHEAFALQVRT
jgi:hypothetical protein